MKKFRSLLMICAIILFAGSVEAQSVGIKMGFNTSTVVTGSNISVYDNLLGLNLGLHLNIPLNEMFSLSTGLFVSDRGYKYKEYKTLAFYGTVFNTTKIHRKRFVYSVLPVSVRIMSKESEEKIKPFAELGGYGALGLSKRKFEEENNKLTDVGMTLGMGLQIGKVSCSIDFDQSFGNICNDSDNICKKRVISFSVKAILFVLN
jgi:hypothetical protein